MRTTLTLEDDVAVQLGELQERRELTFKDAVNLALREGLANLTRPRPKRARRYETPTSDLGPSLIGSLDNIGEVLAIAEGEDYR